MGTTEGNIILEGVYRISTQPVVELSLDLPLTEDAPGPEVIINLSTGEV